MPHNNAQHLSKSETRGLLETLFPDSILFDSSHPRIMTMSNVLNDLQDKKLYGMTKGAEEYWVDFLKSKGKNMSMAKRTWQFSLATASFSQLGFNVLLLDDSGDKSMLIAWKGGLETKEVTIDNLLFISDIMHRRRTTVWAGSMDFESNDSGFASDNKLCTKPPGTPVKKLKNAYLGGNRPWQSAVATQVGFNFGGLDLGAAPRVKMKNGPHKSLPIAFPPLGSKKGADLQGSDEDEDEENSPSTRKEANKYEGLGLGHPPMSCGPAGPVEQTCWLMCRRSSGAFSSGSETSL
ncbi:hypothetical protein OG21DRAFT_1565776, partial [Imleria badia]